MTLARGRFTDLRHVAYPDEGSDCVSGASYRAQVPSATAAVPARVGITAVLVAAVAAFAFASPADGGSRAWSAYLAPAGACKGSTDAGASAAAQQRAVACLMNWARVRANRGKLATSASLRRAAGLKGKKVASCHELSHTPCGSNLIGPLQASGYRYSSFGENLYVGPWGSVTPRDVVSAWLQSSGHRENILRPGFRHMGAALVRGEGILNEGAEAVWTATFASPR